MWGGGLCYEHIRPDGHETPNRHHLKSTHTVVWTPLRYETRESKTPGSNMIPDSGIPSTEVGFGQESTPSPTHGIEYMHYDSGILGNECRCMNDGSPPYPVASMLLRLPLLTVSPDWPIKMGSDSAVTPLAAGWTGIADRKGLACITRSAYQV